MGRKRLDVNEKKINVTISIKKKYADYLKDNKINISKIVEDYVRKFLD
jgi:hypothetical protein